MGRIIRLTEQDLSRIVRRVINESNEPKVGDSITMFDGEGDAESYTNKVPNERKFIGHVCNVINVSLLPFNLGSKTNTLVIKKDITPFSTANKCITYPYQGGPHVTLKGKVGNKSTYTISDNPEDFNYVDCNTHCKSDRAYLKGETISK